MNNKDSIETRIKQYFEDLFLEDSDYLDYELVYNFFIDILINENYKQYDYFVFKTRRSFVLFEIFAEIFSKDYKGKDFFFDYKGELEKVYNDSAIGGVDGICPGSASKILFIDDILIHGRTLSDLYNKFAKSGRNAENKAKVLIMNKEAERVSPELNGQIDPSFYYHKHEFWQKCSNAFVNAIQSSGYCYSTFAPQYLILNGSLSDKFFKGIIPHFSVAQKHNIIDTRIFIKEDIEKEGVYSLIRRYEIKDQFIYWVPFVVLPMYLISKWKCVYDMFCNQLLDYNILDKEDYELIKKAIGYTELSYCFSYRLATYLLSDIFMYYASQLCGLEIEKTKNHFIYSSFGMPISNTIAKIEEKLKSSINVKEIYIKLLDTFVMDADSEQAYNVFLKSKYSGQYDSIIKIKKDEIISKYAEKYIQSLNEENENRIDNSDSAERFYGFSASYLLNTFVDDLNLRYDLLSDFIAKWDSGESSFVAFYDGDDNNQFLGGNIVDGEQAYHVSLDCECIESVNCLFEIYRRSGRDVDKTINNYKEFVHYCKSMNHKAINQLSRVQDYIIRNKSFLELSNLYDGFAIDGLKDCLKCFLREM